MHRLSCCLVLAAVIAGHSQVWADEVSDDDPLVHAAHGAIAGSLNTALETARSNQPAPWSDRGNNLTGSITVFPTAIQAGKPCRSFKYTVRNGQDELIDRGLYCRDPTGLWRSAGVPDLLDKHPAQHADLTPSPPDPALIRLQKNLADLAYSDSAGNGVMNDDLAKALSQFEADQGMRQGTDPEAIRHALALSTTTLERSSIGGVCPTPDGEAETALVCGRRR